MGILGCPLNTEQAIGSSILVGGCVDSSLPVVICLAILLKVPDVRIFRPIFELVSFPKEGERIRNLGRAL